jgi:hypothetical protein
MKTEGYSNQEKKCYSFSFAYSVCQIPAETEINNKRRLSKHKFKMMTLAQFNLIHTPKGYAIHQDF